MRKVTKVIGLSLPLLCLRTANQGFETRETERSDQERKYAIESLGLDVLLLPPARPLKVALTVD